MPNINTDKGDDTDAVRMTAAEHTLAAAHHFTQAQDLLVTDPYLPLSLTQIEDRQAHLEQAWMHLRFAEIITRGADLITVHRHALADPGTKIQHTSLGHEANAWNDLLAGRLTLNHATRRPL